MIIEPKTRGFICTNAHPTGCAQNVKVAADYAKAHPNPNLPKRVLVIGASTGYGLACRVAATFSGGASTVGVFLERPASGKRTATAGYYNNAAFENLAKSDGLKCASINGDAFSKEIKADTISAIKDIMPDGKVDLVVYSLAAPRRTDHQGVTHSSVIKPIGDAFSSKTIDFHTGVVSDVTIEPATPEEIDGTIKVMGGEDWLLWLEALKAADAIAENAVTIAFSYIGPELTHPIYKDGTIGQAKEDLEQKAKSINTLLSDINGKAFVSVNKALVTQASSAIPVVPLYISLLFKIMKENGTHEGCGEQAVRLFQLMYSNGIDNIPLDSAGRIRIDDLEMLPEVQAEINRLWGAVNTDNIASVSDLEGYRNDFYKLFGFNVAGVDYSQPVEITV